MPVFNIVSNADKWKKGDLPFNPMISITLVSYHTAEYSGDSQLITEELASETEINNAVERLIADLKKAGARAKKNLKKTMKKWEEKFLALNFRLGGKVKFCVAKGTVCTHSQGEIAKPKACFPCLCNF